MTEAAKTGKAGGLVNLISFPIEVLGPGKRVGIWFQGCSKRCPGCFSPHTREFEEKYRVSFDEVSSRLRCYSLFTDKLTISGGEPFEQPEFLLEVLQIARGCGYRDIFAYSGWSIDVLRTRFQKLLDHIDVLIDGEFRKDDPTRKIWRGSANQGMHILSADLTLKTQYASFLETEEIQARMQVLQVKGSTLIIGIPRHPELSERLTRDPN